MDRLLSLIDGALRIWQKLQEFLDINGDMMMCLMTAAVIYQIFRGHDIGPSNAASFATAITGLVAWKIKRN